jgi:adhesin transport system membrane fusion protein
LTVLRAPVHGVVKNVRITTLGGVIRPGEEVMQIVPLEDDLVIQAKVSPADIAFLKPGQDVRVKIALAHWLTCLHICFSVGNRSLC